MPLPNTAVANVATSHASRYLQQLCKHWSHKLEVEFDPARGRVVFPKDIRGAAYPEDGVALFSANPDNLEVTLEASSADQLSSLKEVVASHLDRFAFREAPLTFDWR